MMKFFRKYNKHLLAVFMALLLIIWLGGSAIDQFVASSSRDAVLGSATGGQITDEDIALAERESQLLLVLGQYMGVRDAFSWQTWQDRLQTNPPKSDERLGFIEWVLLKREAERFGVAVSADQAKAILSAGGMSEAMVRTAAIRADQNPQIYYNAAASYFSVENMLNIYLTASSPPEPDLRRLARNVLEQATIEAVVFPGASFADPEQTFTPDEVQRHFAAYQSTRYGGGLNFGYYIDPKVKVQYIRIDPAMIRETLRGSEQTYEREAYEYWQANRDNPQFRWTLAEVEEFKKAQAGDASSNGVDSADADTNGVDSNGVDSNGVSTNGVQLPKAGDAYTEFRQARVKALEAVRMQTAQAEAERILNRLSQVLREPWFAVERNAEGIKPAPDAVKSEEYYTGIIAGLPANLQYAEGIEVKTLDWMSADELANADGFGRAGILTEEQDVIRAAQLAFDVEGLAKAPEESHRDTSLFLSQWETFSKPLMGMDGAAYLFRVIGVQPGHAPAKLDDVAEQVAKDLRLITGTKKARQAAEDFVANIGTQGLREAWLADADLLAKVTPDRGGYLESPPFPRDASAFGIPANVVQPFGVVTRDFIDTAFRLAAEGETSDVSVVDLPDEASVVAMHGVKLRPLYMEDYLARRRGLVENIVRQQRSVLMSQWLNAKNVRERNQFEFKRNT